MLCIILWFACKIIDPTNAGNKRYGRASPNKAIVTGDSCASTGEAGRVISGFFGPADEQRAKPIEPGVGALHDSTADLAPGFSGRGFFTPETGVGRVAELGHYFSRLGVVVSRIQLQTLFAAAGPVGRTSCFSGRWQAG
jgi:hypothetical protein